MQTVTQYSEDGQGKELPQLKTGRLSHGCSSYTDHNNNIVILMTTLNITTVETLC